MEEGEEGEDHSSIEVSEEEREQDEEDDPSLPPLERLDKKAQARMILLLDAIQGATGTLEVMEYLKELLAWVERDAGDRLISCFLGTLKVGVEVLLPLFVTYSIDDQILDLLVGIVLLFMTPVSMEVDARVEQMLSVHHIETKQAVIDFSVARYLLHGMTRSLLVHPDIRAHKLRPYFLLLKHFLLVPDAPPSDVISTSHLSHVQDSFIQSLDKESVLSFLLMHERAFFSDKLSQHYMEILSLVLGGALPADVVDQQLFLKLHDPDQSLSDLKIAWETHLYHQWDLNDQRKRQKPVSYQPHLQRHFRPVYARWHPIWERKLCNSVHELTNSLYARYERQLVDSNKTSKYIRSTPEKKDNPPEASFETKKLLSSFADKLIDRCIFSEIAEPNQLKEVTSSEHTLYWYLLAAGGSDEGWWTHPNNVELIRRVSSGLNISCIRFAFFKAKGYFKDCSWSGLHYNMIAISTTLSLINLMSKSPHFNTTVDETTEKIIYRQKRYWGFLVRLLKKYKPTHLSKTYLAHLVQSLWSLFNNTEGYLRRHGAIRVRKKTSTRKATNETASASTQTSLTGMIATLASPLIIKNCCFLLEDYFTNEPAVNFAVIQLLERIATHNYGEHIQLFYQMTLLATFLRIKADRFIQPSSRQREQLVACDPLQGKQRLEAFDGILSFIDFINDRFLKAAKNDPFVWLDSLFMRPEKKG